MIFGTRLLLAALLLSIALIVCGQGDEGLTFSSLTPAVSWREMVESIRKVTRKVKKSVEEATKELELTMQAYHIRNLQVFEQMKLSGESSSQTWREAIEKRTDLFKARANSALRQMTFSYQPLDAKDRFTVLHYADSLSLPRLYRVLRAKEQVESLGHRYALLLIPRAGEQGKEGVDASIELDGLSTVIQLLPDNSSVTVIPSVVGGESSLVDAVRLWHAKAQINFLKSTAGTTAASEAFDPGASAGSSKTYAAYDLVWVVSLEMDWLGSLPQALLQLGKGRRTINPAFQYTPKLIGVGCVSRIPRTNQSSSSNPNHVAPPFRLAQSSGVGGAEVVAASPRTLSALIRHLTALARQLSPLRLLRWAMGITKSLTSWRPVGETHDDNNDLRERDFCYPDLWRVSSDLLSGGTNASTVAELWNAARGSGSAHDASSFGREMGLLSLQAFARPNCTTSAVDEEGSCSSNDCVRGAVSKAEWTAAKEQFLALRIVAKSGIVYSPSGVLFRNADLHDFELHI